MVTAYLPIPDVNATLGMHSIPLSSSGGLMSKAARILAIVSHIVCSAKSLPGHILSVESARPSVSIVIRVDQSRYTYLRPKPKTTFKGLKSASSAVYAECRKRVGSNTLGSG